MTLTLINILLLNPFNVLCFISFKFIYFFTLQYIFELIQFILFSGPYFKLWVQVLMHNTWTRGERNEKFKMTCHGSIWCDVTVVFGKLFIVTSRRERNSKQNSSNPFVQKCFKIKSHSYRHYTVFLKYRFVLFRGERDKVS